MGYPELQEGQISPTSFKQIALVKLLQFQTVQHLDLTPNQEYSFQIVKEPSQMYASILMEQKWRLGRTQVGADCPPMLLAHVCVLCHLDSILPPHPKYRGGKTFTSWLCV